MHFCITPLPYPKIYDLARAAALYIASFRLFLPGARNVFLNHTGSGGRKGRLGGVQKVTAAYEKSHALCLHPNGFADSTIRESCLAWVGGDRVILPALALAQRHNHSSEADQISQHLVFRAKRNFYPKLPAFSKFFPPPTLCSSEKAMRLLLALVCLAALAVTPLLGCGPNTTPPKATTTIAPQTTKNGTPNETVSTTEAPKKQTGMP